jgi:hypothetical protein
LHSAVSHHWYNGVLTALFQRSAVHRASYSIGTEFFPAGKEAEA